MTDTVDEDIDPTSPHISNDVCIGQVFDADNLIHRGMNLGFVIGTILCTVYIGVDFKLRGIVVLKERCGKLADWMVTKVATHVRYLQFGRGIDWTVPASPSTRKRAEARVAQRSCAALS